MRALADLLYPPFCVGCRRSARGGLCAECLSDVSLIGEDRCLKCGRPAVSPVHECLDCRDAGYRFDHARQSTLFEGIVRQAIHRYKYSTRRELVAPLAQLVAPLIAPDAVVTWVPASRRRLHVRGLDHGRVLAESAAREAGCPCIALLSRVRETAAQMSLPPEERRSNLKGAFRAVGEVPAHVVVVDDVFTTGTTASEAARALKTAGASAVSAVAIARGGRISEAAPPL